MANDYTAKFKVDISDLKKNITEANKQIKLANATFKAQTSGMEDWTKNADGLASKLKQLDSNLKSQKSILSSYQEQLSRQEKAYKESGERVDELRAKLKSLAENGVDKASEEFKQLESELKYAIKAQENSGKAVEDLRIKVLNQQATIGKTELSIKKYTAAEKELADESKDTAGDVDKLNSEIDASGKKAKAAASKVDTLGKDAEKAGKNAKSGGQGFTVLKGVIANLASTAISSAVSGLKKLSTTLVSSSLSAAEYADEINTLSSKTGMSTEALQSYKYAAELVDVSLDTLTGSMAKNIKSMSNAASGSAKYAAAYKKLGVAVTDTDGNLRDGETVYWEAIDALSGIKNETERDAIAMQLFGKSAQDLNPLIKEGSKGFASLTEEAKNMGAVMSQEQLDKLNDLDDSMQRLKSGASVAKNALGLVLMPTLTKLANEGVTMLGSFTKELLAADGDMTKVGNSITKYVGKFSSKLLSKLPKIAEAGTKIVSTIGSSIIKALPSLTSSATSIITTLVTDITTALPQLVSTGTTILSTILSGITSALPTILSTLIESIPSVVTSLVDFLTQLMTHADEIIVPLLSAIPQILTSLVTSLFSEDNISKLIDGAVSLLTNLANNLDTILVPLINAVPKILKAVVSALTSKENIKKVVEGAKSIIKGIVDSLPDIIKALVEAVPDIIDALFGEEGFFSKDNLQSFVNGAIDIIGYLVDKLPDIIKSLLENLGTIIEKIFGEEGLLSQLNISKLIAGAVDVVAEIVTAIPQIILSLLKAIPSIITSVVSAFSGLVTKFEDMGYDSAAAFARAIIEVLKGLYTALWFVPGTKVGLAALSGVSSWLDETIANNKNNNESEALDTSELQKEVNKLASDAKKDAQNNVEAKEKAQQNTNRQQSLKYKRKGMAVGGIATKATDVTVGEAGAEAIIPLENNTGWIEKVAAKIINYFSTATTASDYVSRTAKTATEQALNSISGWLSKINSNVIAILNKVGGSAVSSASYGGSYDGTYSGSSSGDSSNSKTNQKTGQQSETAKKLAQGAVDKEKTFVGEAVYGLLNLATSATGTDLGKLAKDAATTLRNWIRKPNATVNQLKSAVKGVWSQIKQYPESAGYSWLKDIPNSSLVANLDGWLANQYPRTIQVTQNNYSPTALNRAEIYRDTQHVVSLLKGAM